MNQDKSIDVEGLYVPNLKAGLRSSSLENREKMAALASAKRRQQWENTSY